MATRPFGGIIPAPTIQALMNAGVDFETNVRGQRQKLSFSIETASLLNQEGGITISPPVGFEFDTSCTVLQRQPLPAGFVDLPEARCETVSASRRELSDLEKTKKKLLPQILYRDLKTKTIAIMIGPSVLFFNKDCARPERRIASLNTARRPTLPRTASALAAT